MVCVCVCVCGLANSLLVCMCLFFVVRLSMCALCSYNYTYIHVHVHVCMYMDCIWWMCLFLLLTFFSLSLSLPPSLPLSLPPTSQFHFSTGTCRRKSTLQQSLCFLQSVADFRLPAANSSQFSHHGVPNSAPLPSSAAPNQLSLPLYVL